MAEEEGGERTEAATPRHIQKAREAGSVAVSREAATLAVLTVAALMLAMQAPQTANRLSAQLALFLEQADTQNPITALRAAGVVTLTAAAPFLLAAALAGAGAVLAQTGGMVNLEALLPDPLRLSPSRGLSRILSLAALLELGKSVVKLAAAAVVLWSALSAALPLLPAAALWDPATLLDRTGRQVLRVLVALLGAQAAMTGFDIVRARLAHAGGLRMTRQQVREEHKESEGDPHIKNRLKRLRLQRSRKRMLKAVPKAAVVIVNPTHYAVALAYERGTTAAPRVVAKGVDVLAARIREIAAEHRVPVVTNPVLARALYPVDLDAEIPRELFQAVAEIIAYIWGLRRRTI